MPGCDPAPAIDQLLGWVATHEFLAETIPSYYLEFAADHFAALLGADLEFRGAGQGGWAVPCIEDLSSCEIHFDTDGKWWRETVGLAEELKAGTGGRMLITAPSLVANLDALAALYGTEKLLMAMVDRPDEVHRALEQIDTAHGRILDALAGLFDYANRGSLTRHGMYSAGRTGVLQCDLSCMLGPDMFREFVVPHLEQEAQAFDHVTYHLDGPGALQHLETLTAMPGIDIIQWVPGAGEAQARDWSDLYDRIDRLGKGTIRARTAREAVAMWRTRRNRLFVCQLRVGSKAEAEDCIAELQQ
jgi:5-methyltetrahydrofolate--homocysteine methyltransferase